MTAGRDAQRSSSDWPNEDLAGYARVVRSGDLVWVAGTTATAGDQVLAPGDMYQQSRVTLEKIRGFLADAGVSLADVVQTRAYLTRADGFRAFAQAHREVFAEVRPVNTTVVVSALAHPDMLVEIEALARVAPSHG